jgi:hypothetical protein
MTCGPDMPTKVGADRLDGAGIAVDAAQPEQAIA